MIYFIIPFKTTKKTPLRFINLKNCLKSLEEAQKGHEDFRVLLTDYGHSNPPINTTLNLQSIHIEEPFFNRNVCINLLSDELEPDDKLFILDSDMLVPPTMIDTINGNVRKGRCYFPVCWSMRANGGGWWRESSWGMCGVVKSDFELIGRYWQENKSWGGSDVEFGARARKTIEVKREHLPGLIHQWHPDNQGYKNIYYEDKPKPYTQR